jgi:hypothetical protein
VQGLLGCTDSFVALESIHLSVESPPDSLLHGIAPGAATSDVDPAVRVRDAIVQLTRLVQRAAIYPQNHPTVRLALGPFVEALSAILATGQRFLVVIMRDRLVASAGASPGREHQSRWLAQQLHARGFTSLAIESQLDADELLQFITWLTRPAAEVMSDDPPLPTGVRITRIDYQHARFDEAPAQTRDDTPDAVRAWEDVVSRLMADDHQDGPVPTTAAGIGAAIGESLARAEGLGISMMSERLFRASDQVSLLPVENRTNLQERLAGVVSALPDDLRHHILSAVPDDDPRKLQLLTSILDSLPAQQLLELVPRVNMERGPHVPPFLTFLSRLAVVATREASVSEQIEAQFDRYGLPNDLLHVAPDEVTRILHDVFNQTVEQYSSAGELYQASLRELATADLAADSPFDLSRYTEANSDLATSNHVAEIAMWLARDRPVHASTAACLSRARHAAQRQLGDGGIELLAELAVIVRTVSADANDAHTKSAVQECATLCRQPAVVDLLVAALARAVGPTSAGLTELFLISGLAGTSSVLWRMSELPDGGFRDRLGLLVAQQDLDLVRSALRRAHEGGLQIRGLLDALRQLDPARSPELARLFMRDPNPAVRRYALEMLSDAPLSPIKRERVMVHALTDEDADVVRVAVRDLGVNQTRGGLYALTTFLGRTTPPEIEPLQAYAMQVLRRAWSPAVGQVLRDALLERRHTFEAAARRVSLAMMSLIDMMGDEDDRAAARAWRRSAAGLWSFCLGQRGQRA